MRCRAFAVLLLVAVACAGDSARERFIETILEERAAHWNGGTQRSVARAILGAERDHGVSAFLLLSVAEQESHFRLRATSRRGARGMMQVRPATAADVAARHGIRYREADDLFDPGVVVSIAAAYLTELRAEFGSWELALAAYHRGPTRVRALVARDRPVRSRYARRVLAGEKRIAERYAAAAG